jgi:uncharacterized protein (DUF488 family)
MSVRLESDLVALAMEPTGHPSKTVIWTIGHSTRPVTAFIALLREHAIQLVVDVRSVPRSRKSPQYNVDTFPSMLSTEGIAYEHTSALGGFRRARTDSANLGWRNEAFRGYADYTGTEEFKGGLKSLIVMAEKERTAIMSAESLPWRCHRSLIADALIASGIEVRHIMGPGKVMMHGLTPWAAVREGRVTYPATLAEFDTPVKD